MRFELILSPASEATVQQLAVEDPTKYAKVTKTLGQMEVALRETRSLNLHKINKKTADGRDIWTAYVENNTPGAWRVFWAYGVRAGTLEILLITRHPEY